jgi:hypothetical protein
MKALKFPPITPEEDLSNQSAQQIASSSAANAPAHESVKTGMDAQSNRSEAQINGEASGGGATALTRNVARTGSRVGAGLNSSSNRTIRESGDTEAKSAPTTEQANLEAGAAGGATAHATAQATGLRRVMFAGASGKASGTLSATRQNVHLERRTQMVLGVSSAQ